MRKTNILCFGSLIFNIHMIKLEIRQRFEKMLLMLCKNATIWLYFTRDGPNSIKRVLRLLYLVLLQKLEQRWEMENIWSYKIATLESWDVPQCSYTLDEVALYFLSHRHLKTNLLIFSPWKIEKLGAWKLKFNIWKLWPSCVGRANG